MTTKEYEEKIKTLEEEKRILLTAVLTLIDHLGGTILFHDEQGRTTNQYSSRKENSCEIHTH